MIKILIGLEEASSVWCRVSLLTCVVLTTATAVAAQPNYLENGDFDTDIAGWTGGNAVAAIGWDGTLGSPSPGSLRITVITNPSGPTGAGASSECVVAPAGSSWLVAAEAREELGSTVLGCGLVLLLHETPDCTDVAGDFAEAPQLAGNDWTVLSLSYTIPGGFAAIKVIPTLSVSTGGAGACNFDSIRLLGPPNVDVPALDRAGMLALVGALALVGLILLRLGR